MSQEPAVLDGLGIEINDSGAEKRSAGHISLTPPPGYQFDPIAKRLLPKTFESRKDDDSPSVEDQVRRMITRMGVRKRNAIPSKLLNLPRRFLLTGEDFSSMLTTQSPRNIAEAAMSGDTNSYVAVERMLALFLLLMEQDSLMAPRIELDGTKSVDDEGNVIRYKANRWAIDSYADRGVMSGERPMPGFFHSLVIQLWLTDIMPNLEFAMKGDDLPANIATDANRRKADLRLDPKKNPLRERALQWLAAARKKIDAEIVARIGTVKPNEKEGK